MAIRLAKVINPKRRSLLLANLSRQSKAVVQTSSEALQAQPALLSETFAEEVRPFAVARHPVISFEDPESIFAAKSTASLLQSFAVLKACRIKPFVHNAETLLKFSKAVLGQAATGKIVESTFFNHFCAGTNAETIKPTLARLAENGMLPILNYAAEDDVETPDAEVDPSTCNLAKEPALDRQLNIFMRSVGDCNNRLAARGFVGIKLTGLTQPILLERMSSILGDEGGPLDHGQCSGNLQAVMKARLSPVEFQAFQNLMGRVQQLAHAVHTKGNMRMLVDAEQTYMQPAIDAIVLALQQIFNKESAVVMNTYQCYLKDTAQRLEIDLSRAEAEGWVWGAKTVRGAYMHQERARAAELGIADPIQEALADTHDNYNSCVEHVMSKVAKGQAELMVASHNQASVEKALSAMHRLNIPARDPGSGLYFGQLLGMADNLSFPLGAHGYNIYKICAYGSVNETIRFLMRRALENSDAFGGCAKETELIGRELVRRLTAFRGRSTYGAAEQPAVLQHA